LQVMQERHTDRGVLGRALTQAEGALGAIGGDPQHYDHRLARVLDAIDHDRREVQAVETAFSQGLNLYGGGPDEVAADVRFLDSEAIPCKLDKVFIVTSAHATGHAAEHGLGQGIGGLQSGVGLQRDLAAAVGASHAGPRDGELLARQGRRVLDFGFASTYQQLKKKNRTVATALVVVGTNAQGQASSTIVARRRSIVPRTWRAV
jgi:hypothetical protein